MLYKNNSANELKDEVFKNPGCEYRGAPFWAWNCELDKDELLRQIDCLKDMGFGGYHIHPRVGFATPYLSEEFMALVKSCVEKGKQVDMNSYLYDEDRWPSGSAGGIVTKNRRLRGKRLFFTKTKKETVSLEEMYGSNWKPYLYATYDIILDEDGKLLSHRIIGDESEAEGEVWYAHLYIWADESWYNNQGYIDTLSAEAMDEFIKVTYGAYEKAVGKDFGGRVPSIFTDEPEFTQFMPLQTPEGGTAVAPWTEKLPEEFKKRCNKELVEVLPEFFFEKADGVCSDVRYHYFNVVSDFFAESFAGRCGKWCDEHGIALTGHLMYEPSLKTQSQYVGDAMRSYRYFGFPGIDILCDAREFTTAKQCQSIVHQCGKEAMMSELYGVTSWDYDFKNHKSQGDWQAALGVTLRVPHLSWVSMKGEAKRDYPASINYQAPWYKEYSIVEDHFARVNTALTRGKPIVNIAVIHPVESLWMIFGPSSQTEIRQNELDNHFSDLTKWLLYGNADFDFINEASLPDIFGGVENGLKVGEMNYQAVIVPDCITLRKTTLNVLKQFSDNGGKVIFAGNIPSYLDAEMSDEVKIFAERCECVEFDRLKILDAVAGYKDVSINNSKGLPAKNMVYAFRQDNNCKWLFIAHGEKLEGDFPLYAEDLVISINGEYEPKLYDTLTGKISDIPFEIDKGITKVYYHLERTGSLLLKLNEKVSKRSFEAPEATDKKRNTLRVFDKISYKREEPNVLLLDLAEYSTDGGEFRPLEEILKLNNICKDELGWPRVGGQMAQPWVIPPEKPTNSVTLRFRFFSELEYSGAKLALEDAESAKIIFNGKDVNSVVNGWYVDKDILTVDMPKIIKGENELTVTYPFGKRTSLEWMYLLGEFNVKVEGCSKTIVPMTDKIAFGSITDQGMPFYGGNIRYEFEVEVPDSEIFVHVMHFKGALIRAYIDGKDAGPIAFAPFNSDALKMNAGKHKIELVLYGNRYNTFGPLHSLYNNKYIGPGDWRSIGDGWSYEYNIRPTGITSSPEIFVFTDK
ncbi:MAG: hypothetical protein IJU39_00275 [Clostridia bacterium]|nr:hypothetical protein [Clostridia bacterium]